MIKHIPNNKRYLSDHGWLRSYFLFSFAEYFEPENMSLGSLRVFNDDTILGRSGFPMHSHRNMEIVTLMFKGELTHEDSLGNKALLTSGSVQRMSASTGVTHSEYNYGEETIELYQIWVTPSETVAKPEYEEAKASFDAAGITEIVGPNGKLSIHSDTTFSMINIEKDESMTIELSKPNALIYIRSGAITTTTGLAVTGDQLRMQHESTITFTANSKTQAILIQTI